MSEPKETYHLRYAMTLTPGKFAKAELGGDGGTDALLLASVLYPPDGSLSVCFLSKDGRTGEEMEDSELFKVWAMLAHQLAESETLGEVKWAICVATHEAIRAALAKARP